MTIRLQCREIAPGNIELTNETFLLAPSCPQPDERLISSIKEFGILMPPVLLEKNGGFFQVVTGWRRILSAINISRNKNIICLVAPSKTREADCLSLALEDILFNRTPSAIELALFLKKMAKHHEPAKIVENFSHKMNLPPRAALFSKYINLLDLEEPLVQAVHNSLLDVRIAFELTELNMRDRLAIFDLVESLRLSVSNQKNLLIACRELAGRYNTSILAILADSRIIEILHHQHANIPQKTAMIMNCLENKRFPLLHAAESDFRQFLKDLKLPEMMTLAHSPSFEEDSMTLSITCSDRREVEEIVAAVTKRKS
jgi:hypothetical protein